MNLVYFNHDSNLTNATRLFSEYLLRSGDDDLNECYSVLAYLVPRAILKDSPIRGTLITWVDPPAFWHNGKCISASYWYQFSPVYFY